MLKSDVVGRFARTSELTKSKARLAVDAILAALKESLWLGRRIEIRGFGSFQVRPRKSGLGRNPHTGAEAPIAPGKRVKFKPGKALRSLK